MPDSVEFSIYFWWCVSSVNALVRIFDESSHHRQVRYTSTGKKFSFVHQGQYASPYCRKLDPNAIVATLVRWTGPAVKAYFETGEITGAAQHL